MQEYKYKAILTGIVKHFKILLKQVTINNNMSKEKSKQVVIIGGSYAGILALKTLLKSSPIELNITLISPNDSGYFNAAAPRLLIEPESIEKTIFPIKPTIEN